MVNMASATVERNGVEVEANHVTFLSPKSGYWLWQHSSGNLATIWVFLQIGGGVSFWLQLPAKRAAHHFQGFQLGPPENPETGASPFRGRTAQLSGPEAGPSSRDQSFEARPPAPSSTATC